MLEKGNLFYSLAVALRLSLVSIFAGTDADAAKYGYRHI